MRVIGVEGAVGAIIAGPEDQRAVPVVVGCDEARRGCVAVGDDCIVRAEGVDVAYGVVGGDLLNAEKEEGRGRVRFAVHHVGLVVAAASTVQATV